MVDQNESRRDELPAGMRGRRRGVPLGGASRDGSLTAAPALPLALAPGSEEEDLISWAMGRRQELTDQLVDHGAILFRGFHAASAEDLERFIRAFCGEALDYTFRSTPRSEVSGKIYTSTEYPADQSIPMHNEMSYTRRWPRKIWFLSLRLAASGGETPLADSRKVYQQLAPRIRDEFNAKGVMYIRNYGTGLDLSWQDVFQTQERAEVEAYCRGAGIELEWRNGDELRTRQVCQATATHPETGEDLWFNQAHLFHVSSLDPAARQFLLEELGEDGLPRHACYGDGSPIPEDFLRQIREAYDRNQVVFPWRRGDVLMVDNMMIAHGRRPFTGDRKVVVGMAEAWPPA
jgi:alpha-ketoglutarate-dependent taurine dioxygenase